jgi:hypothetical protein
LLPLLLGCCPISNFTQEGAEQQGEEEARREKRKGEVRISRNSPNLSQILDLLFKSNIQDLFIFVDWLSTLGDMRNSQSCFVI